MKTETFKKMLTDIREHQEIETMDEKSYQKSDSEENQKPCKVIQIIWTSDKRFVCNEELYVTHSEWNVYLLPS